MCCPLCFYKNMHEDHKILEITDEDTLKKENISIENSMDEFNKNKKN